MTALTTESISSINVFDELKRQCDSEKGRAIFDSPFLADFVEEEFYEENPEATYTDKVLAKSQHEENRVLAEAEAKERCNSCSFRESCLQNARELEEHNVNIDELDDEDALPLLMFGVVGGLTQDERAALFVQI